MEADTISKNAASSKSHTSSVKKILYLFIAGIVLCGSLSAQSELRGSWVGIFKDGRGLNPPQIREIMSVNEAALKHYNSGRTFEMVGAGLLGAGMITAVVGVLTSKDSEYLNTVAMCGAVGLAAGLPVYIIGRVKIANSVRLYNAGLRNNSMSYQMNFGITPSGGIGVTMAF